MLPKQEEMDIVVRHLQARMYIMDWEIEVNYLNGLDHVKKYKDTSLLMSTDINPKRNEARIDVNCDQDNIECEWYHDIIHELVHVLLYPYDEWRIWALSFTDQEDGDICDKRYDVTCESVTDRIARIIEHLYPLDMLAKDLKLDLKEEDAG